MKKSNRLLFSTVAVAIMVGVGVRIATRQAARDAESKAVEVADGDTTEARSEARSAAIPATIVLEKPREASVPLERAKPVNATGQTNSSRQKSPAQGGRRVKEPLRDPMAREALALVGVDVEAEAYWYEAINDLNLPPGERQDLIEDLNEDGLSDPKHPTADDLSLIVRRLLIIEEVGWDAKDKVNADAFREAYKDLVNLANVAFGGGESAR